MVLSAACKSDLKRVADFDAARFYHDGRYKHECAGDLKTPYCVQFRKLVNDALDEANLCNATQKIGKLPPTAKKRIKQLQKAMEEQKNGGS